MLQTFVDVVTTDMAGFTPESDCKAVVPADSSASSNDEKLSELFKQLDPLWKTHRQKGLFVRYETGRMLVDLIGPPSNRQKYGAEVLESVSERIGVSRSDLSRMRKFANAYSDLDTFQSDHPECNSWTKVKEHLATIDESGKPEETKAKKTYKPIMGMCRSITLLAKKVKGFEDDSTPDTRKQVIDALQPLVQAMRDTFGVALQVETDQDSVLTIHDSQAETSRAA